MLRRGRAAAAVAAALTCAVAVPATANAGLATQPENVPSVAAGGYEWGASRVIADVTCDAACQRLVRALNEEPGDLARRKNLQIEAYNLGVQVKTLPRFDAQPPEFLVDTPLYEHTWAIGQGARTKYLEEDVRGTPVDPLYPSVIRPVRYLRQVPAHHIVSTGTWGDLFPPSDGYAAADTYWGNQYHFRTPPPAGELPKPEHVCGASMSFEPIETVLLLGPKSGPCPGSTATTGSVRVAAWFRARTDYKPSAATTRTITATTETWTAEPDAVLALNDRTTAELLTAKYPLYNQLADAALKPDLYTDPRVTAKSASKVCDRATPAYHNAGGNLNPYTLRPDAPFTIGTPPTGYPSATSVQLKEGSTYWAPGRNHDAYNWGTPEGAGKPLPKQDLWSGWGHRFNVARYGWGPTDVAETQAALTNAVPKNGAYETRIYDWMVARAPNGTACQRRVVIDLSGNPSRGIVGSYNLAVAG